MSWWTKNRKKVLGAAALGSLFIPGVNAAVMSGLQGILGTGAGAAGAGAGATAGATIPEALLAAQGVGNAALATPGGLPAALAMEGGSEAGLAGLDAISKAKFGAMATPMEYGASLGNSLLSGAGKVAGTMGKANMAMNFLGGNQQPPMTMAPARPQQVQTEYFRSGYAPPMSEEELRRLLGRG